MKFTLKIFITLIVVYAIARFIVVFSGSMIFGTREPYIQQLGQNSVVIRWQTDENEVGVVRYGEDYDIMEGADVEMEATKSHSIKLTELKPGTKYYYQAGNILGDEDFDPAKHWFVTHPDTQISTRIWVIGDSGQPGETQQQVKHAAFNWMRRNIPSCPANISEQLVNVWISLGDIAYRSGTNEQFQAGLFDAYPEILSNTPLWPVYGNHDDRRWAYFRIFDLPEQAEAGGVPSKTENYYSFNYSNVHFVMLDSQDSKLSADSDMANWLREDLESTTKAWVIAAFHHPVYTKGSHDSDNRNDSDGKMHAVRENILPILERYGVDLVLSGHSHMYERSHLMDCAYQGSEHFSSANIVSNGEEGRQRYYVKAAQRDANQGAVFVVAGSSSKVDQGPLDHPAHVVSLQQAGSMIIDVDGLTLTARFINDKGQVADKFQITKQEDYVSNYAGCGQPESLQEENSVITDVVLKQ